MIDKAIEQGVVKPKRKQGKPLLPAHEVALLVQLRQIDVALPTKAKQHCANGWQEPSRRLSALS